MNISSSSSSFNMAGSNLNSIRNNKRTDNADSQNMFIGNVSKSDKIDKRIENLMKQKESIQENIQKLKEGKKSNAEQDAKEIIDKVKELQAQMEKIDTDIKEAKKEKSEQEKPKEVEPEEKTQEETIVSLSSSFDKVKKQNSIKSQMESKIRILRMEMKLDSSRTSGGNSSPKQEEVSKLESKVLKLAKSISQNLNDINQKADGSDSDNEETKENNQTATKEFDYNASLIDKYNYNKNLIRSKEEKTIDTVL